MLHFIELTYNHRLHIVYKRRRHMLIKAIHSRIIYFHALELKEMPIVISVVAVHVIVMQICYWKMRQSELLNLKLFF